MKKSKISIIIFLSGIALCILLLQQGFAQEKTAQAVTSETFQAARIFGDNMVIQQGMNAPVWGKAAPDQAVTVNFDGFATHTTADSTGKWLLYLPPSRAGGPYDMKIESGGHAISFSNVMVGEVWLASGQSNMAFAIGRPMLNSAAVIKEANYPAIREFHVPGEVSSVPMTDLKSGEWKICSPQTAADFSAVAYFFARSLHLDQKVAVGIIHCSVSGSLAEAWLSADMLFTHPDFKNRIIDIRAKGEDWASLQAKEAGVQASYGSMIDTANAGPRQGITTLNYDDGKWEKAAYPFFQSKLKIPGYRLVWLRKTFEVTHLPKAKTMRLFLGEIKMRNVVYLNGTMVGKNIKEGVASYTVPTRLLKKGKNIIAVRWLCEWGYGRFGNNGDMPELSTSDGTIHIQLGGEWSYNGDIEPDLPAAKGYSNNPTALFNGMLAPVIPYGIRGALWYQGEGNSDRAEQYQTLLPLLFTDWRIRWKEGNFPFLIVQLPNYKLGGNNWINMRESQAMALRYPNTGLTVTTDVGDSVDVHPINKQPVGERLYASARAVAYHLNNSGSGPVMETYRSENGNMIVRFSGAGDGLMAKGDGAFIGFMIAGEDHQFYPATVTINGGDLLISSGNVQHPVAVRYNWEANTKGNFYNKNGLPAAPFRTDNWSID